jgi:ABC-type multidrug transport system ATPase subunit
MNQSMPLKVENLSYGFRDPLFQNVSLTVAKGEFVTVVVSDPAMKTTLIDCLVGNLKPAGGRIDFWGFESRGFNRERIQQKVGWVLTKKESHAPWIRVGEYLLATKNLYKIWNENRESLLVTQLGLDLTKRMSDITTSDAQKIRLIKALAFEPKLLILDDITFGLSPELKATLLKTLLDESLTGALAILNITANGRDTAELSDKVIVLNRAKPLGPEAVQAPNISAP